MLNLYETYYKLSADPFRLSPDHKFAYGHTGYANAKAYLEYAFFQGEGFVMVTGEPGTGKTTLINEILSGLEQSKLQVATLTTTQLDTRDLLHMVAVLLGMQITEVSKPALLMSLKKYLTGQADRGWRSILVVDEAQGLSPSGLEELRLLANLQHREKLLIQICLIGQDQLRDLVQRPEMEHLRQRIIAASHLTPLTLEETIDYIEHRLRHAGWKGDPGISEGALRQIHEHSGGIPRLINLICNRLFLYGGLESRHEFMSADAGHVIGELIQEQLLQSEQTEEDAAKFAGYDGSREASELSLPRASSLSANARAEAEVEPEPERVVIHELDPVPQAADRSRGVRAELGEPYISTSGLRDPVPERQRPRAGAPEKKSEKISSRRHITGVMILLSGLVLLLMFGSEVGSSIAGLVKSQFTRLVSTGAEVQTAVETGQRLTPEIVNSGDAAIGVENSGADRAVPQTGLPVENAETLPPATEALPAPDVVPASGMLEVDVVEDVDSVETQEPQPELAVAPAPPEELPAAEPAADQWESVIAEEKRRLDEKARQTFERQVGERFPDRPPVEEGIAPSVAAEDGPRDNAGAELSSLEPLAGAETGEDMFSNLKEIHVALLEGRWTLQGKPAIFLPSEITFCGQGETHAQISCWSVPQYVAAGQRTSLQKIEATLKGFSSKGDFELVYRAMNAPVDNNDGRLFWQTTEHRLWCKFSGVEQVTCSDRSSGEPLELKRSPLSNNNSVGIGSQGVRPG